MSIRLPAPTTLLRSAAIVLALLAPFVIYFGTARSIVSIWNSSDTFAHGYIILPISLWLIWSRRRSIAHLNPTPFWPALLLLVACGFGWLLADLGDVQVVRQYAFVAMLPLMAVAVLGLRISWAMAFPLLFLMLAVPFGEIFIDPLINFTADFTVAAVAATGIPVLREGTNFSLPTGNWSVVEACSGVRYLIASFTLGCLYAYLTYRSRARQAVFILLSIVVPIIANGLRAYMIVMIGHFSGMELATGADHLVYGWVFFGIIMFLMFWIGSFWREDQPPTQANLAQAGEAATRPEPNQRSAQDSGILAVAIAAIACIGIWPLYANYIERAGFNPVTADLAGFRAQWQDDVPFTIWKPSFSPANAELYRFFKQDEKSAGMTVIYYRNQQPGSVLISSTNQLVTEKDALWRKTGSSVRSEAVSNRQLAVRETLLQGSSGPLVVWHWYWIDNSFIINNYLGKLLQAKEKFLLKGDDGAAVMVFAPYVDHPDEARTVLRNFLNANLAPLETTLIRVKAPGSGT